MKPGAAGQRGAAHGAMRLSSWPHLSRSGCYYLRVRFAMQSMSTLVLVGQVAWGLTLVYLAALRDRLRQEEFRG